MKATIENGVLWIGCETYEEILITDHWERNNAEGIKFLKQDYKTTGRRTPTIEFVGIVPEDKSKPPKGFENQNIRNE